MNSLAIKTAVGPTILLSSGNYFDFLDPWHSVISIDDIAAGLSKCCRFAGQCEPFYSVASHSVFVSKLVAPQFAFAALMHDAAEAFLGDITRPLKSMLPQFKAIERDVEAAIFARFGVDMCSDAASAVKYADLQALAVEQRDLMPSHSDEWQILAGIEVPQARCETHDIETGRRLFLERFVELNA